MQRRIYLASPYTANDSMIREARYREACKATAFIMGKGDLVFSPIVHSHVLAKTYKLPGDFEYWQEWCLSFLHHWATHLVILHISGWQESRGIAAEKSLAEELGLPVLSWKELMKR